MSYKARGLICLIKHEVSNAVSNAQCLKCLTKTIIIIMLFIQGAHIAKGVIQ